MVLCLVSDFDMLGAGWGGEGRYNWEAVHDCHRYPDLRVVAGYSLKGDSERNGTRPQLVLVVPMMMVTGDRSSIDCILS